MFGIETLLLFIGTTLAINLSPGPSILYVTTVATSRGLRAALASVAGMSVGVFGHVIAAATGVAALLAASTTAFSIIKYLGAAYLIYLGIKILISPAKPIKATKTNTSLNLRKYFYRGIFVDLFNPKIGLFFLAFLPQFVVSSEGSVFVQSVVLGLLFIIIGGVVNSCIAFIAANSLGLVRPRAKILVEKWIPGCVLVGLGARLAYEEI